jgi:hypothetical protein
MLVGLTQAIHQAAVDNGKWSLAAEYVIMKDPLAPVKFAGHPAHVNMIMTRADALLKLEGKMKANKPTGKGDGDEEDEPPKEKYKPKGK